MYKPELPPREVLERVIEAALWAPSGVNLQAWEITVMAGQVRDDFVALVSQAVKYLLPRLKQANLPEEAQEQVMKFFKNLGGAPVVMAVTIFKVAEATPAMSHDPERRRPDAEPAPGGRTPRAWAPAG